MSPGRMWRCALPPQLVLDAAQFAAHKHKDQRRKNAAASLYINHPLALANILRAEGEVEDVTVIVAALLHDTIEDTETDYDCLWRSFQHNLHSVCPDL